MECYNNDVYKNCLILTENFQINLFLELSPTSHHRVQVNLGRILKS